MARVSMPHQHEERAAVVGSTNFVLERGITTPHGAVHLADAAWMALCGGGRMRFLFPAMTTASDVCTSCVEAVATKQRRSGGADAA